MKKNFLYIFFLYLILASEVFADIQSKLINNLNTTKTLSFDFEQKISDTTEVGNCFIKYPLLMKCNYKNLKQKTVIANGKTVAIIKKKYKKIYLYPIKSTPLFNILKKEKILDLIKNNKPTKVNTEIIEYVFIDKKSNKLKIFFDRKSLNLKGWETIDAYSNKVNFLIKNLKVNNQIMNNFFKIPNENDL